MENHKIKEFHQAYIKGNMEDIKTSLSKILPMTLIKFYSAEYVNEKNYGLESLKASELWLSSPSEFNDPFDCALNINKNELIENIYNEMCKETNMKFTSDFKKNLFHYVASIFDKKMENHDERFSSSIFVSCFSEASNISSILMWSHYATYHKGFCVEYDFREMNRKFKIGINPVYYSEEYLVNQNDESDEGCRAFHLAVAYTKASVWEYEKEWRLLQIREDKQDEKGYLESFVSPKAIYLGCRIQENLMNNIIKFAKKKNIKVYKMQLIQEKYKLHYKEIT